MEYEDENVSYCTICGAEKPNYAKKLCIGCTVIEILHEKVDQWIERMNGLLNYNDINIIDGFEYELRSYFIPKIASWVEKLPEDKFPQIPPKACLPMRKLSEAIIRNSAEDFNNE